MEADEWMCKVDMAAGVSGNIPHDWMKAVTVLLNTDSVKIIVGITHLLKAL